MFQDFRRVGGRAQVPIGALFLAVLTMFLVACVEDPTATPSGPTVTPGPTAIPADTAVPTPTITLVIRPTSTPIPTATPERGLVLGEWGWETGDFGIRYVTGIVTNESSSPYSFVSISVNLYDLDDNQVGSTLDNISNLAAGGTWKWRAVVLEDDARRARVTELSGF